MKNIFVLLIMGLFIVGCSTADKSPEASAEDSKDKAKQEKNLKDDKAKKEKDKLSMSCTLKGDKRNVIIEKNSGEKLCEVRYSKFGDEQRIASAEHQEEFCSEIINKVKNNLQEAGFNCG